MAEFQKVMKQAKRMCASYGDGCRSCALENATGQCPLVCHSGELVPMDWSIDKLSEIERIVMDWAAKHPEPRYLTWAEWLRMLGVERLSDIIPADIAEKLGIKPIGGDSGV